MNTFSSLDHTCHGVEGPMTTGYYCSICPFYGGGKKKDDKKLKAFYDWATTGIPVKMNQNKNDNTPFAVHYQKIYFHLCQKLYQ